MVVEDLIDINGLDEFKTKMEEYVRDYLTYEEKVYIGAGQDESTDLHEYTVKRAVPSVVIPLDAQTGDDYIFIAYPKSGGLEVKMGGFEVPFENLTETIIDDRIYKIDRSTNTYNGLLEVTLIMKY